MALGRLVPANHWTARFVGVTITNGSMRHAKLGLLLCSTVLACSGRYVGNPGDGEGAGARAPSATGGKSTGGGEAEATPPVGLGGATSVGAGASTAGGDVAGPPPPLTLDTACGVPLGQPSTITSPITNSMMWWFRLSKLIWGAQGHAAPELPTPLSYPQAGKLADAAIDQALAETQGIPGVEAFVRSSLRVDPATTPLLGDWNAALSRGPALDALLGLRLDGQRVGAFTEPAFLKTQPTISWRGTVLFEALFAQQMPPEPPGGAPFMPPAGLTRREGLAEAASSPACAGCHHLIDPLGWSLENYDQDGKYVTSDAGQPVDASGRYTLPKSGAELQFQNIDDLGLQLTQTCDANLGLADRFLTFAMEQSPPGNPLPDDLLVSERARVEQAFMRNGRTYRSLINAYAQGRLISAD